MNFNVNQTEHHYMINDGLTELAANAVEFVIDQNSAITYAVYLSSKTSFGESSSLVRLAKFNIMQPTNVSWMTVFDCDVDFDGARLSECNIIDLNASTVRVFVVNMSNYLYYYKDVDKKSLKAGPLQNVKFSTSDNASPVWFSLENINKHLEGIGGSPFTHLQFTTEILAKDGFFYTTVCGGNAIPNFLFLKSQDGETWSFLSLIHHPVNYEAMLTYHAGKFWVFCRNGATAPTEERQQNLLYSEDGFTWHQSNLALTTSDTRPYLFTYQGDLCLAYSSPMPLDYSSVRPWRCNIHIGKIVSKDGMESFEEFLYRESRFGIVYYALKDWYGYLIMLYSSGELHPTEGLMDGWSQGKDCLNYTILRYEDNKPFMNRNTSITVDA